MASISHDKTNGTRTIQFVASNKRRRSIRLGQTTKKQAETVKAHVEEIISATLTGSSMARETAAWVGQLPDVMRDKLVNVGLVEPREMGDGVPTIAEFISGYIAGRTDVMPNTLSNLRQAERALVTHVGTEKRLDQFTKADAKAWLVALKSRYSSATAGRWCGFGSQFFEVAVEAEILERNPFKGVEAPGQTNKARQHYIDAETAKKVIDTSDDVSWRL